MQNGHLERHGFINFQFASERAPATFWQFVGEITGLCKAASGVPLQPETHKRLQLVALTKGVRATTAIEGNTLTLEQVEQLAEDPDREVAVPSMSYQNVEITNMLSLMRKFVACKLNGQPIGVSVESIQAWNRQIIEGTEHEQNAVPGRFRGHVVGVFTYRAPEPKYVKPLMVELARWLNRDWGVKGIEAGVIKSVVAHLYLAWIHPFGDGNGRTARAMEEAILIDAGVPTIVSHTLSDHYNRTRSRYYKRLAEAQHNPFAFYLYALEGLRDGAQEQLNTIKKAQTSVMWEHYVHSAFSTKKSSETQRRRRTVVLSLPHGQTTATGLIPMLSPKLAAEYANRGSRMLARDINAIVEMGLVHKKATLVWPAIEVIVPAF